ncbi:MAG: DUF4339 domain-containing protein [Bdellovibrionales bacterium]|nr:DUF4339 domain-containing protein [Bdellovibrionales bacterium]
MNYYLKNFKSSETKGNLSEETSLKGPFNQKRILQFLFRGWVSADTKLLKSNTWKSLSEYFDLFSEDVKSSWTLLKKYKGDFIQTGPYSQKGIQTLLKQGFLSDQDFVWREGFSSWKRISLCSEFHTRIEGALEDFMDQEFSKANPAPEVLVYKRESPNIFE